MNLRNSVNNIEHLKVNDLGDAMKVSPDFVAKALQAILCLHKVSFAGRKNKEKLCFEMFSKSPASDTVLAQSIICRA